MRGKSRRICAVLLLFGFFSILTVGSGLASGDRPKASCKKLAHDPFEPDIRIPRTFPGIFSGQCVDARIKRSLYVLTKEEAQAYGAGPEDLMIANFRHQNRFWFARIPNYWSGHRPRVESVYFLIEKFIKWGGHIMLRFVLAEDSAIELTPQPPILERDADAKLWIRDVIYSPEAVGPEGALYAIHRALLGNFVNSYRFMSTVQKLGEIEGQRVVQLRLSLDEDHKFDVLRAGVRLSDERGLTQMYRVTFRNCSSEVFDVLDLAIPYDLYRGAGGGMTSGALDGNLKDLLDKRGIYSRNDQTPDLTRDEVVREILSGENLNEPWLRATLPPRL